MAKLVQSMRKSCVLRIDISVGFMKHIAPYRFTLSLILAKINLLRIDYSFFHSIHVAFFANLVYN